ncbi:aldehyde dehydrogenase family protein [Peribacillus sp. TH27]|uniref:aldehyde dehydrogenase family protein n=1 Tax=Peribacillus sp. TH27 TaxID=2798484 RepID=UPI0019130A58|nr:aldehyde dehydrogenase family protein [Peribacillus sp. TH27]MBK5458828.1 aldehyde dehydrogenase family protein [Peribacillus sp. TH27]
MSTEKTVSDLVERAKVAQKIVEGYSQRKLDELAAAIVYTLSRYEVAQKIAKLAVAETDMGDEESKIKKLTKKMPAVFYQVKSVKTVGVIERDLEMGIRKIAKPVGIIAALVPSTNSEATPVFKGVLSLRARNAIIFAPHPRSKNTTKKVVDIMRNILEKNGAPKDLFICIETPSKEISQELMSQCDLTMATGSGDMVKAAYSSGKPAYGVGAGNAVVVIDETANLADAAEKIRIGKLGDLASGCSAENSLVIKESVYNEMIDLLKTEGGYLVNQEEKEKLKDTMWVDGHLSREIVAKPASRIAEAAGFSIPNKAKFIMVEESGIGQGYPFSGEKMSVVVTIYKYNEFDEAIEKVNKITAYSGYGHSCGIHSNNDVHIMQLALNTKTTKVIVRQPHGMANSGAWFNGLANTFSLGCGTWGGNIVSENVTQKHYMNTTWVAEPIDRTEASEEEIFGDLIKNAVLI